jgi:hypothetical protein
VRTTGRVPHTSSASPMRMAMRSGSDVRGVRLRKTSAALDAAGAVLGGWDGRVMFTNVSERGKTDPVDGCRRAGGSRREGRAPRVRKEGPRSPRRTGECTNGKKTGRMRRSGGATTPHEADRDGGGRARGNREALRFYRFPAMTVPRPRESRRAGTEAPMEFI